VDPLREMGCTLTGAAHVLNCTVRFIQPTSASIHRPFACHDRPSNMNNRGSLEAQRVKREFLF
jgi:hypothetical protein